VGRSAQTPPDRETDETLAGKRYIVLIEVAEVKEIHPFAIDRSQYGNMDDWLPVENIELAALDHHH